MATRFDLVGQTPGYLDVLRGAGAVQQQQANQQQMQLRAQQAQMQQQQLAQQQQQQAMRQQVGGLAAGGDFSGAQSAALASGDPQLAAQIAQLDAGQREAARSRISAAAPVLIQAQQLRDVNSRRALLASAKPGLLAAGWSEQEIDGFDPTDTNIQGMVSSVQSIDQALKQLEPYTLSPGSARYVGSRQIAAQPFAPQYRSVGEGQTLVEVGGDMPGGGDPYAALIQQESGGRQFGPDGQPLTSPAGAVGVAQVMPGTGPEAARLAGLPWDEQRYRNDPAYNEAIGRAYHAAQLAEFGGDETAAAAAYNAGPNRVRQEMARGGDWQSRLPAETRDYIARVAPGYRGGGGGRVVAQGAPRQQAQRLSPQEVQAEGLDSRVEWYRNKDGIPVAVGGDASIRRAAEQEQRVRGKETFAGTLSGMVDAYLQLDKSGGIVNPSQSAGRNVVSRLSSLPPAQSVQRALGVEQQSIRDRINASMPLVLQGIMQASGMSARQMDSNRELQFFLQAATDPQRDIYANLAAIHQLDRSYGTGGVLREMLDDEMYKEMERRLPALRAQAPAPSTRQTPASAGGAQGTQRLRYNPATGDFE